MSGRAQDGVFPREVLCARRVLGAEAARQRGRGGRRETRRPVATDCAPRLSSLPPRRGYVSPHSHGGGTSPAAAMARVRGPGQGQGTGVASVLLRRPRLASTGAPLWSSYKHAVKSPSDSLDRLAASHAAPFFQCPQVRRRLLRTTASGWFRGEQPPGLGVCSLTQEAQERVNSLRGNPEQQVTASSPRGLLSQPEMTGPAEQPCARRAVPRLPAQPSDRTASVPQLPCPPVRLSAPASQARTHRSVPRPPAPRRQLRRRHPASWRTHPSPFTCFSPLLRSELERVLGRTPGGSPL